MKAKQEIRVRLDTLGTRVAAHRQRRVAAALVQRRHPTDRAGEAHPTAALPHDSLCLPREPPKPPACANPPTKAPSRAASDSARPKNHTSSALGTPRFNPAGNRS